jgi:hypothetical protein
METGQSQRLAMGMLFEIKILVPGQRSETR